MKETPRYTLLCAVACALFMVSCGDGSRKHVISPDDPPDAVWLGQYDLIPGNPEYSSRMLRFYEDSSDTRVLHERTWGFASAYTIWYGQPGGDNGKEWFTLSGILELTAMDMSDTTLSRVQLLISSRGDSVCSRSGPTFTVVIRGSCDTETYIPVNGSFPYIMALDHYLNWQGVVLRAITPPIPDVDTADWIPDPGDITGPGIGHIGP